MKNNFFSSIKMKMSIGRLSLTVLMLLIVVFGGTFAWLTFRSNQSALVLTIGTVNDAQITLTPYQITGTVTPVTDYTDGTYSDVIINKGTGNSTLLYYKINQLDTALRNVLQYKVVCGTDYKEVKSGYFKDFTSSTEYAVIWDENTELNTALNIAPANRNTYQTNLLSSTCTNNGTNSSVNYRVYTWVNSAEGSQNDIQGSKLDMELNGSIGSVTIIGKAIFGQTLTASITDYTSANNPSYSYQWYSNTTNSTSGGTAISGATAQTYTIGSGLAGKYIYVVVTVSEMGYTQRTYVDITDTTNNTYADVAKATNPMVVNAATDTLTYNCSAQTLVQNPGTTYGEVYYSTTTALTSSNYSSSGSKTLPTGTNVGNNTVYYYTPGNNNYAAKSGNVSVMINAYVIIFHNGDSSSTPKTQNVSTCTFTLSSFSSLGFSVNDADDNASSHGWTFYGWTNVTSGTNALTALYSDGDDSISLTGTSLNLYALYKRTLTFVGGYYESADSVTVDQHYNSFGTTETVTFPSAATLEDNHYSLTNWDLLGYRDDDLLGYSEYDFEGQYAYNYSYSNTLRVLYFRYNGINLIYQGDGGTLVDSSATTSSKKRVFYNGIDDDVWIPEITLLGNNVYQKDCMQYSKWKLVETGDTYDAGAFKHLFSIFSTNATSNYNTYLQPVWIQGDITAPSIGSIAYNDSGYEVIESWVNTNLKVVLNYSDACATLNPDNILATFNGTYYDEYGTSDGSDNGSSKYSLDTMCATANCTVGTCTSTSCEITYQSDLDGEACYTISDGINESSSTCVTLRRDTSPPDCSIISGADISVTGSDNLSGYRCAVLSTTGYSSSCHPTNSVTTLDCVINSTYYGVVMDWAGNSKYCMLKNAKCLA